MKELICIVCPKGCHLVVDDEKDYQVRGNQCPRGAAYGQKELTHPTRVLTSTIKIQGSYQPRVSVRTTCDVDKQCIWDIMKRIAELEVQAPVHRGDVVEHHICGTDADLIITKDVKQTIET